MSFALDILAAGSDLRGYMLLAVVAGLALLLLINARRRLSGRTADPQADARQRLREIRERKHLEGDMQSLLEQLEQLSARINAQVDTKFVKLEQAIADADRRIAELRQLLPEAAAAPPADDGPPPAASADGDGPSAPASSPGASRLDVVVDDRTEDGPAIDPEHLAICQHAADGLSAPEIARRVGRTTGEIELILNLHRDRLGGTSP